MQKNMPTMVLKITKVWKVITETLEDYTGIVGAIGEQLGAVSVVREYYLLLAPISREAGKEIENSTETYERQALYESGLEMSWIDELICQLSDFGGQQGVYGFPVLILNRYLREMYFKPGVQLTSYIGISLAYNW